MRRRIRRFCAQDHDALMEYVLHSHPRGSQLAAFEEQTKALDCNDHGNK